jgi:hypothetical protein
MWDDVVDYRGNGRLAASLTPKTERVELQEDGALAIPARIVTTLPGASSPRLIFPSASSTIGVRAEAYGRSENRRAIRHGSFQQKRRLGANRAADTNLSA